MKIRTARVVLPLAVIISVQGIIGARPAIDQGAALAQSSDELKLLVSPSMPVDAAEVSSVVKSAKVGDQVTVRGYIALAKDAIGKGVFMLAEILPTDATKPGVKELPATADVPQERRAVVKLVTSSGGPVSSDLNGRMGLRPGVEVFVVGKVTAIGGAEGVVIAASSFHVPRSSVPAGMITLQPAANVAAAKDLTELRKAGALKAGDTVTFRARVGGSKEPFVAGRAVFTVMGRGLKACSENPDDNCPTPWDYCCETRADITANSATIQLTDEKGQVLRTDVKGRRGIKELTEIVVTGKVVSAAAGALVVNATSIAVGS